MSEVQSHREECPPSLELQTRDLSAMWRATASNARFSLIVALYKVLLKFIAFIFVAIG
jgi:hypothetical protein